MSVFSTNIYIYIYIYIYIWLQMPGDCTVNIHGPQILKCHIYRDFTTCAARIILLK
jgi:hypothetical protein